MRRVFIWVLLALFTVSLLPAGQAEAAFNFYGRTAGQSYFKGDFPASGWYVFNSTPDLPYEGITPDWQTVPITANVFIDQFSKRLNSTTNHNRARAAATIMMMLGVNGPDPIFDGPSPDRWRNGVTVAQARFAEWAALVRYYDSRGWVNFNDLYTASSPMDWLGAYDGINVNPHPDMMAVNLTGLVFANEPSITFYNPNGTQFNILKKCVNMAGEVMPLQTFNLDPKLTSSIPGNTVSPGQTYALNPGVENTQSLKSLPFTLSVRPSTNAGLVTSPTHTRSGIYATGSSYAAPNWRWDYGNGLPQATDMQTGNLGFTVRPNAAAGQQICFIATVSPSTMATGSTAATAPLCLTVVAPRYPGLVGMGADIHAGGGTDASCIVPPGKGLIRGNPNANTFGQYSVSGGPAGGGPGGTIFNFGSNGAQGNTSLLFNETPAGAYGPVCREDLIAAAGALPPTQTVSGTLNLNSFGSGEHIVRSSGPLTVFGKIGNTAKVTILADGDITISGNITQDNAYSGLGLLSRGNILIDGGVTKIVAYLYADGEIDTCSTAACGTQLRVEGLMSANSFRFDRLGTGNGAQPGETVAYRYALLISPPPGFSGNLQGLVFRPEYGGELAPRL